MIIRRETRKDYQEVFSVIQKAFASAEHSDGNEQDLVARLRNSSSFIPDLSLVAEQDDKIIGHILFSKVQVGNETALALAPLSVLPEFQTQGIGSALIKEGHRIAKELGYQFSIVLGSEQYYPRFGYQPASQFGIQPPFEVPDENFMALNLMGKDTQLHGTVQYAKEFFEI